MTESGGKGRNVHARIPYVSDKEFHVSTVESPQDGWFVDVREYIPSLDAYGRGITFPGSLFPDVMAGLDVAYSELGYDKALDQDRSTEAQLSEGDEDG